MTYNEIFKNNNIALFTKYSGFTAHEAIAKIQSGRKKTKMFIHCSDLDCRGINCLDCLIHPSHADELLLWLQQFVSKPDTITYFNNEEFEEGDLVIVTEFEGNPDYNTTIGNWINNGEIIRLGGQYWSSNSPLKLKNGEEIMGETIKYPLGNSTGLCKPEKIKIRHATPEEIAYYNKVGLGANIKDMKKEETILTITQPKPRFKVGDIVTFKDRKDCEHEDGQIGKYWFGGENYDGKKVPITTIGEYMPAKNCYVIEVGQTLNYLMLECEFQEYDAEKIETSKMPVQVNCSNSLQRNFCFQQKGETDLSITSKGISFQEYLRKTNSIEKWVEYQKTVFSIGKYIVLNKSVVCIPAIKVPLIISTYKRETDGSLVLGLGTILWQVTIGDIIDSDYTLFDTLEEAQDYCGIEHTKPLVNSYPILPEDCVIQTNKDDLGVLETAHWEWFDLGISEPIAKKGDYVVFLGFFMYDKEINISGNIPINHCYCLSEDFEFTTSTFRVEKDKNGNTNNSFPGYKNRHIITRPATSEEIAEYKRLDKPFDVTQPYLLLREQLTDKENIVDTYQFIPSKLPQFPQQKNKYIIEIQEEEPIFLGSKPTFKQLIK